jgi:hypothetical protein
MGDLTSMYSVLDELHYDLFNKYKDQLDLPKPRKNFLKEKGVIPSSEALYGAIALKLKSCLEIILKLKVADPSEVHQYLRRVYSLSNEVDKIFDDNASDEPLKKLLKINKKLKAFIKSYQYKLTVNYQANSALLLSTMLYESVKKSTKANIKVAQNVLKIDGENQKLTLQVIAKKIGMATGINPRNIQFIAIGISSSGRAWITTNYHSPVVYPLTAFLSKEKYKEAEKLRKHYKLEHRTSDGKLLGFASGSKTIHAETMIASLKSLLGIQSILLVDAGGNKAENCQYCSHYLNQEGFTSQPHIEAIQNYTLPTEKQKNATADFVLHLDENLKYENYRWVNLNKNKFKASRKAMEIRQNLLGQAFTLLPYDSPLDDSLELEQIFNEIKESYPLHIDSLEGLKDTFHLSHKLSSPEKKDISRLVVRSGAKISRHPNLAISILDDDRLKVDISGNKITPVDPTSPRSSELCKRINFWAKQGDPSVSAIEQSGNKVFKVKR